MKITRPKEFIDYLVIISLSCFIINIANARQISPDSLYTKATQLIDEGKFDQALEMGNTFKELYDKTNDSTYLVKFYSIHAPIYYYTGKFVEAESFYTTISGFSDRLITPQKRANTKFSICECNRKLKNFFKSYKLCLEALSDFKRLNMIERKITTEFILTDYWITLNQLDSAKFYMEKAMSEAKQANLPYPTAQSHIEYAKILSAQKDWKGAIEQTELGVKLFEIIKFWPSVIYGYNEMAKMYLKLNKYHSAAQAASNVLEIINEVNMPTEHCQALIEMSHAYNSLNLLDQATYWLDSAERLLPTISTKEYYLYGRYYEVKKEVALKQGDIAGSKLAEAKYLEIQEENKKLGTDYPVTNARLNYELEVLQKNYDNLDNTQRKYYYLLPLVSVLCLVFIVLFVLYFNTNKSLTKKNEYLISELEEIRQEQLLDPNSDSKSLFDKSKFNKVNSHLKYQLNDTDFKLLEIIHTNPYITNKDMSLLVNISYEGVRSALKKMYKIFDVAESAGNKKLSLLTNLLSLSSELTAKAKPKDK